jgi:hypothetical protein
MCERKHHPQGEERSAMTLTIFDPLAGKLVRIDLPEALDHDRAKRHVCRELDRLAENKRKGAERLTLVR